MILDKALDAVTHACCSGGPLMGLAKKFKKSEQEEDVLDTTAAKEEEEEQPQEEAPRKNNVVLTVGGFTAKQTKYETKEWKELTKTAREAAEKLGFTEELWRDDHWPHAGDKHWHDLTEEERQGAETLGWDKDSWDTKYEHLDWDEIPAHVKKAAESVGFDEVMWNSNHWPEESHKSWNDLTDKERTAYAVLGYSKKTWD
jgi:hypothetical protein